MVGKIGLIAMIIVFIALSHEIGYCRGYEQGKDESEKFVKGKEHEEKSD